MALLQSVTNTLSRVFPVAGRSVYPSPVATVTRPCAEATFSSWLQTRNRWLSSIRSGDKSQDRRTKEKQKEEEEEEEVSDPYLPPWPGGVNPRTGERGGPRGPEPTRYGDWERKGRVSDF